MQKLQALLPPKACPLHVKVRPSCLIDNSPNSYQESEQFCAEFSSFPHLFSIVAPGLVTFIPSHKHDRKSKISASSSTSLRSRSTHSRSPPSPIAMPAPPPRLSCPSWTWPWRPGSAPPPPPRPHRAAAARPRLATPPVSPRNLLPLSVHAAHRRMNVFRLEHAACTGG